jgi:hypothetical protein
MKNAERIENAAQLTPLVAKALFAAAPSSCSRSP